MGQALTQFDANLPSNPQVRLRTYGKNRIVVTPLEPQAEPAQLNRLKVEIGRRWPMTNLLDVLKETDLRVGFSDVFKSLGTREILGRVDELFDDHPCGHEMNECQKGLAQFLIPRGNASKLFELIKEPFDLLP